MTKVVVPLADLCKMDRRQVRPADEGALSLPFVGVEHVVAGSGVIDFDSDSRVGSQKSAAFRFDARHVLYGKLRPYLNKVATPGFAGKCSTELIPLLPQDGVDRDYLAHLLRRRDTVDFVMAAVTGSRMPRADMKVLLSMRVPLPPLDEQRRIVAILNRAAKIERLRARAVERLREFVPALFVKMFGDPVDNPVNWPMVCLGDVVEEFRYGTSGKCSTEKGSADVPVLRIPNVVKGVVNWDGLKFRRLDGREAEALRLRTGDILFVRTNGNPSYIGRCAVFDGARRAAFASYLIRARLTSGTARPAFLSDALALPSMRQVLLRLARTTAGNYNISIRSLASLVMPLPPIGLQKRYESLSNQVRAVVSRSEVAGVSATALSGSMMAKLLARH